MRIAICLSGKSILYKKNYNSLFYNIIKDKNVDIFLHTWNNDYISEIINVYKPVRYEIENFTDEFILNNIKNKKLIEKYKNKEYPWYSNTNSLGQYYSLNKCNILKKEYEQDNNFKYDIVVRCRLDLNFTDNADIFNQLELNKLYHSNKISSNWLNDQFFFSNSNIMDIATDIFNNVDKYFDEDIIIFSENTYQKHWDKNDIIRQKIIINYKICRENGLFLHGY